MNFTINDVDQVIERTNCSYKEAKEALEASEGDVVDAIIYLENKDRSFGSFFKGLGDQDRTADSIIETIKDLIREGNVNKIEIRDPKGRKITSVSVNVGAAIGSFALLVNAPLVAISSLIAKYGLNYQFVVVKADGTEIVL